MTSLLGGLLLTSWGLLVFNNADPLQAPLTQFAAALPEWAVSLLALAYSTGLVYTVLVILAFLVTRSWAALRDLILAGLLAGAAAVALVAAYGDLWPQFFIEFQQGTAEPQFPIVRVAVVGAILLAAAPYLTRPVRRLGWLIVSLVALAAIALALSVPSGAVAALGIALAASAAAHLIFGSTAGYPDVTAVATAAERLGIDVRDLRIAQDQSWGVRRFIGTSSGVGDIEVKAYGRDATDSQVLAKVWHAIVYRGGTIGSTVSRLQSVEHEALMTITAGRAGAHVPDVLVAAAATDELAILATSRSGVALAQTPSDEIDDSQLESLWHQLAQLHDGGLTHGGLDATSVRTTSDGLQMTGFAKASVVFRDSAAALDVVQLLYSTAVLVGGERALAVATAGYGSRVAECLPFLQVAALSSREDLGRKGSTRLLKELRESLAQHTGQPPPEPAKLRRFGLRQLVTLVVVLLFLSAVIPLVTGIDYEQMWNTLQGAHWSLVALALLVGQVVFIPQATAMTAAVGREIPLRPIAILQPAIQFISFAVPGVAGRMAMQTGFLHRFGVAPNVAVVKSALDSFAGFLAQIAILLLAFATDSLRLASDVGGSETTQTTQDDSSWLWLGALILILVLLAVVIVVLKVPRIRDRVVPQVSSSWTAMSEVLRSPRRAFSLLGSQLAVQFLWGLALWLSLLALDVHLSIVSCTAVVVATALLAGIIPVPGAVGVSAAIITTLLVPLGVPVELAMGGAVFYRLTTFYLPSAEGLFASKYLQKHGYL